MMLRFFAFGIGAGAAFQAWRNFPPDGPVHPDSLAVLAILGMIAAYLGGLWRARGRGTATATAVATAAADASAQAAVQVNIYGEGGGRFSGAPLAGAATDALPARVPDESVSWFGGERAAITADDLDGLDLDELRDPETA